MSLTTRSTVGYVHCCVYRQCLHYGVRRRTQPCQELFHLVSVCCLVEAEVSCRFTSRRVLDSGHIFWRPLHKSHHQPTVITVLALYTFHYMKIFPYINTIYLKGDPKVPKQERSNSPEIVRRSNNQAKSYPGSIF